jgi:hypothetical protein
MSTTFSTASFSTAIDAIIRNAPAEYGSIDEVEDDGTTVVAFFDGGVSMVIDKQTLEVTVVNGDD